MRVTDTVTNTGQEGKSNFTSLVYSGDSVRYELPICFSADIPSPIESQYLVYIRRSIRSTLLWLHRSSPHLERQHSSIRGHNYWWWKVILKGKKIVFCTLGRHKVISLSAMLAFSFPFQKLVYFLNRKYKNVPDAMSHRDGIAIMISLVEVLDVSEDIFNSICTQHPSVHDSLTSRVQTIPNSMIFWKFYKGSR